MAKKRNRRPAPRGSSKRDRGAPGTSPRKPDAPSQPPAGEAARPDRRRLEWIAWAGPVALGLAALGIYTATLAPSVPTGDSGELITTAYVAGVAHPPGYPLYTMLGWIATHLLPGSPAVIMNFLSALAHAGAVALIAVLTARLVVPGWPRSEDTASGLVAGLVAGAALALSTVFWTYALVAEVFALNNLFAAAILLVAIEWYRDRSKVWALASLGLLSGLAAAHQQTIVFLAPGLLVLLIAGVTEDRDGGGPKKRRRRSQRQVAPWHFVLAGGLIVVGLLAYLYLPIAASRDPVMNFGDPENWDRFWRVLTRKDYGSSYQLIPNAGRGGYGHNMALYLEYLWRGFTPIGLTLAVAGAVFLARRFRVEFWALLAAFLASGPLFVFLASSEITAPVTEGILERFYMLSTVVLAIAVGAGALYATVGLHRLTSMQPRAAVGAIGLVAALLAGTLTVMRWGDVDHSDNRVAYNYGRDMLRDLEPGGILLTRGDHNYTSLSYAQHIGGLGKDVTVVEVELLQLEAYVTELRARHPDIDFPWPRYTEDNSLRAFVEANFDEHPIYLTGPMPDELTDSIVEVRSGLVRRVAQPGTAGEYDALIADPSLATDLTYPDRLYPEKTWEAVIGRNYGVAAHSLAFALHADQPNDDDPLAEEMYRLSIAVGPPPEAYKNLGLFLFQRNRDAGEIIDLWETYIGLDPDDPQLPAIEKAVRDLKAATAESG